MGISPHVAEKLPSIALVAKRLSECANNAIQRSMTRELVAMKRDGDTTTLQLNDPERMNALSEEMLAAVRSGCREAEEHGARCLIIEGAGNAFSAGGDIAQMHEYLDADISVAARMRELRETFCETIKRIATTPTPIIAKIDGIAVGAGASLAIACDIQYASKDSSISFGFRQVGLSVDAGTSYFLPRLVGENKAKELVLTGKTINAEDAHKLGLLNQVYPKEDIDTRTSELASTIAEGPTLALQHATQLIGEGQNKSLEQALADEVTAQGIVFESADHETGVEAFLEKREPEFIGE